MACKWLYHYICVETYNLASSTDREIKKYDMDSAEIIFRNLESLMQTFSYGITECPFLLMKQLVCSYRKIILEFLSVNHNLHSELELLKKTNADLIYKANMHHLKEVFHITFLREWFPSQSSFGNWAMSKVLYGKKGFLRFSN